MKFVKKRFCLCGLYALMIVGCNVKNDAVVDGISGDTLLLRDVKTGTHRLYIVYPKLKALDPSYALVEVGDTVLVFTDTQQEYDSNFVFDKTRHMPLEFTRNYGKDIRKRRQDSIQAAKRNMIKKFMDRNR